VTISAGGSALLALTDHFADPDDAASDLKSPAGCAARVVARRVQPEVKNVAVEWIAVEEGTTTCEWTACPGVDIHAIDTGGAGPFEAAPSYARLRPAGSAVVTLKGVEARPV
jgi:hypothetical protein